MPSDHPGIDLGLLSPLGVATDRLVADDVYLAALVTAEVALTRAWAEVGGDRAAADALSATYGWSGPGELCGTAGLDLDAIARAAVSGGNPVIPLVAALRSAAGPHAAAVHRGATSQDILDSAVMVVAWRSVARILADLDALLSRLGGLAREHRDTVAVARTLTQHAVPTTIGLRIAAWMRGIRRAHGRLAEVRAGLPAQLGGAAGTLAAFVAHSDAETAGRLPAAFAAQLGLAAPDAPWHTERWPVTELGDALVQVVDALGVLAADVATGSRTEIAEWAPAASAGGSSAMPQKRNPTEAVLVRSAAIRAPQLGATLHAAAALAVDERPDGAWHAEWPTLRELLRVALGAAATARRLADGLIVDRDAVARNVALTRGLVVAERVAIVAGPGIDLAAAGDDLSGSVDAALDRAGVPRRDGDVAALLDPAGYTGLAGALVDREVTER